MRIKTGRSTTATQRLSDVADGATPGRQSVLLRPFVPKAGYVSVATVAIRVNFVQYLTPRLSKIGGNVAVNQRDLHFVGGLKASRIEDLRAGDSVVRRTGQSIDRLIERVVVDRLRLATEVGREAQKALRRANPSYRTAISRAYYAMYQTCRSVVFFDTEGDDHQEHTELPKHLPDDFPARATWENTLKNARLDRNRADYEPYPRQDAAFAGRANDLFKEYRDFQAATRAYLRGKGLKI